MLRRELPPERHHQINIAPRRGLHRRSFSRGFYGRTSACAQRRFPDCGGALPPPSSHPRPLTSQKRKCRRRADAFQRQV